MTKSFHPNIAHGPNNIGINVDVVVDGLNSALSEVSLDGVETTNLLYKLGGPRP